MAADDKRERVITDVSEAELKLIDELAEKLHVSRAKFLSILISVALADNEWIVRLLSSKFMEPVMGLVKSFKKGKESKS